MGPKPKNVRYTQEFKDNAVKLWMSGRSKVSVCAELEISVSTLDDWIKKAGADRGGTLAGKDPGELSSKELLELSRQQAKTIKRLELEKEILEKATAFFAAKVAPK